MTGFTISSSAGLSALVLFEPRELPLALVLLLAIAVERDRVWLELPNFKMLTKVNILNIRLLSLKFEKTEIYTVVIRADWSRQVLMMLKCRTMQLENMP